MSKSPIHVHLPFLIGAIAGVAVAAVLFFVDPSSAIVGGAITFFLIYLIHTATRLPFLTAAHLKTNAARDDPPAWIILLITVGAVVAAIVSLFLVLHSDDAFDPLGLALSLATVALGWFTIHTMTALTLRAPLLAAGRHSKRQGHATRRPRLPRRDGARSL